MPDKDFLLEVGCEEIPSRFIPGALEQFRDQITQLLAGARLDHGEVEAWGTPRRFVTLVRSLADKQEDLVEKIKGPPAKMAYDDQGEPGKALQGFMRTQGVDLQQIEIEEIKGTRYVFACKEIAGRPGMEILPALLTRLLEGISFPRPMYWYSKEVRFARPIRWLLTLYGRDIVPFNYAGLTADRKTYGHRFLLPGPHEVENVEHFFRTLRESHVILDHEERRENILIQVKEAAKSCGGRALVRENLLEEVNFLVENPVAVKGSYAEAYLKLPREVLSTTMQVHQRYFPVESEEGRLLPYFVGISNNLYHDNIQQGYEKVLQARLADAQFFFDEDLKKPLEAYVNELQHIVFMEALGSMDKKRQRLQDLVKRLARRFKLPDEVTEKAGRAAYLCKADLVTGMVGEFPELQGTMGREYARRSGEAEEVALAICEHYLPRFNGDTLPQTAAGALLALSDRMDTLAGCFAAGIRPTGSQDPYGLRRQAQGVVAILLEFEFAISPLELAGEALQALTAVIKPDFDRRRQILDGLKELFNQRLRYVFQEKGCSYDVVEAVLAVPGQSIAEQFKRAELIEENMRSLMMEDIITIYNRTANLSGRAQEGTIEPALFQEPREEELFRRLQEVLPGFEREYRLGNYAACLRQLQSLKDPVDDFFDQVLVMSEDERVKDNRLKLLARITGLFNRIAVFSHLQKG